MKRILNFFILVVTYLICSTADALPPPEKGCTFDDWVSSPDIHNYCKGCYREAPVPFPGQTIDSGTQPITITSDKGRFVPEGNSTFSGNVHLIQGNRQLYTDSATIHRDPTKQKSIDFVKASGHLKLTEPGLRVDGTQAELNIESDCQTLYNASYRLYTRHARGTAECITVCNRTQMTLHNATYTTCAPGQDTWILKGKKIELDKIAGRGTARDARLYFKNAPILYTPYLNFPIDDRRQSGFLFPTFRFTNVSGTEMGAPFYWNIAPNYDATLTPTAFSKRGVQMTGLFRYLTFNSTGELAGAVLPQDRAYQKFLNNNKANHPLFANNDPRVTGLNTGSTRSGFRAKHTTTFNEHWTTNIQYAQVHDDNYFVDFGNSLSMASTTQLLQQGELLYQDRHWSTQARLQQYQTLHPYDGPVTPNVYERLPQLAMQNLYSDLPYGFEWATTGDFTRFMHQLNPFTGASFTTGDRYQLRPQLSLPIVRPGWYLKPRAQYNLWGYSLRTNSNPFNPNHPNLAIPMLDLDTGLLFERSLCVASDPYIQTLEPRAYYLYVPFRKQSDLPNFDTTNPRFDANQLYRDNRFSGLDRLGDANQLTLGLTTRFLNEKIGNEVLSLGLGQIFYFTPPRVTDFSSQINPLILQHVLLHGFPQGFSHTLPPGFPHTVPFGLQQTLLHRIRKRHLSDLVGLARLQVQENLLFNAEIEWNHYHTRTDKFAVYLQYLPYERTVFNIGYQFLRRDLLGNLGHKKGFSEKIQQTDLSCAVLLTEQWRLLSSWHYDLQNNRSNKIAFGIEQQGCCTAVRLFAYRFLPPFDPRLSNKQYTKGIFLQFVFKGLGGVGPTGMSGNISQAIPGYQWREDEY